MFAEAPDQVVRILPCLTVLNERSVSTVGVAPIHTDVKLTGDARARGSGQTAERIPTVGNQCSAMMGHAREAEYCGIDEFWIEGSCVVQSNILVAEVFVVWEVQVAGPKSVRLILVIEVVTEEQIFVAEFVVDPRQVLVLVEAVFVVRRRSMVGVATGAIVGSEIHQRLDRRLSSGVNAGRGNETVGEWQARQRVVNRSRRKQRASVAGQIGIFLSREHLTNHDRLVPALPCALVITEEKCPPFEDRPTEIPAKLI